MRDENMPKHLPFLADPPYFAWRMTIPRELWKGEFEFSFFVLGLAKLQIQVFYSQQAPFQIRLCDP